MIVELSKGVALLLALSLLQSFVLRRWPLDRSVGQAVSGLLFGGICIVGMMTPLQLTAGVIFDARSVILSMAGLFGGPIVGAIAGFFAGSYRLWVGGAGAWVGLGVVVTCVSLGLAFRYARDRGWVSIGLIQLLIFGFLVHVIVLSWFLLLPPDVVKTIFSTIALPFIATFSLATPALGLLLLDAQKRVTIERVLLDQTQRFETVLQTMSDGISVMDEKLNAVVFNDRFLKMLEFPVGEFEVGDPFEKFIRFNAERGEYGDGDIDRLIEERVELAKQFLPHDFERTRPDGTTISIKGAPLPEGGFVTLYSDVTEQKMAEMRLIEAKEQAENASRAKSDFLAAMSHDLRTPLNSILGFVQLLEQQAFGPVSNEKYREYHQIIRTSAEHLLGLVEDILDLSQLESEKFRLNLAPYDPVAHTSDVIKAFEPIVREREVSIELSRSDNMPNTIWADMKIATQIQNNFISNAVREAPPGSTVEVRWSLSDKNRLTLEVRDYGRGFPEIVLSDVGQPFLVSDPQHSSESKKGFGLGLYICKRYIESRGGTLILSNPPDGGALVVAEWPAEALSPQADIMKDIEESA